MSRMTAALTNDGPSDLPAAKPALHHLEELISVLAGLSSGPRKLTDYCNEDRRLDNIVRSVSACDALECWCVSPVPDVVELAVFCSTGCGPGYDTVFSVVLMCSVQRSDAGCKSSLSLWLNPLTCACPSLKIHSRCTQIHNSCNSLANFFSNL